VTAARAAMAGVAGGEPYELPVTGSLRAARWATFVAGASLVVSAVMGIRYGKQALYQSDDLMFPQVYGQDIVALIIAFPAMMLAMWRASRGSGRGLVVWAGALIYLAYWYHYFLGGVAFGAMFPVHAALVASSLFAIGVLILRVDIGRFAHRFDARMPSRSIGALMVLTGSLFATAWILDVVRSIGQRIILDQASLGVYTVDLTVMLPVTIAAGLLLWRHTPWGYALSGPLMVNALLSVGTLAVASSVMRMSGMTVAGIEMVALWSATLIMAACCAVYLRALRG
jgi:hypothetical protein